MFFIGDLRRFLMIPFSCKWNAWVRDITAKHEGNWLIRSKKNKKFLSEFCPDCGVGIEKPHIEGCDIERCSMCGMQKLTCDCVGSERVLENWMGIWPERGKLTKEDLNGIK